MKIISGHGRVQAAIKLGMKEVPVIISHMNQEMADEFRIVDNVTQAAGKIDMVYSTADAMYLWKLDIDEGLVSSYEDRGLFVL